MILDNSVKEEDTGWTSTKLTETNPAYNLTLGREMTMTNGWK
jgi:hypothetical protein